MIVVVVVARVTCRCPSPAGEVEPHQWGPSRGPPPRGLSGAGTREQVLHVVCCDPAVWALVIDVWVNTVHVDV